MSIAASHLRRMKGLLHKCRFDSEGAVAAEFALIVPVLFLLIIGIFEFGRLYWIQNSLQYAAEQTGRCVMANPTVTSVTSGTCVLSNNLPGITADTPTTGTETCSLGTCRWVQVTYTYSFIDSLAGLMKLFDSNASLSAVTLTGKSEVPIS
jgi:Flp pilus assembly protein TadG